MNKQRIVRILLALSILGLSNLTTTWAASGTSDGSGSESSGSSSGSSSSESSSTPTFDDSVFSNPTTDSGGTTNRDLIRNANDIKNGLGQNPTAAQSRINDYKNQPEIINITPTDGLVKVMRTSEKVNVNDYQTAVIRLRYADPREIRNVMRLVTGLEGGYAEVIRDQNDKENMVQVVAPNFMIPYLRSAIEALDVQWLKEYWTGSVDLYLKLQNRGDAAFVDKIASTYAGFEGFTTVDTTNNALRRLDEEYRINEYKRAVEAVDIPANQVLLEVKLYEISDSNDTKLGLDYINWKNGPGRNLFDFAQAGYDAWQRAHNLTSIYDPFLGARVFVDGTGTHRVLDTSANESYHALNYLLPSNFIDFLNVKGRARVLNSQTLMVQSAKTARIFSDQQVLAFVVNDDGVNSTGSMGSSSASAPGTVTPAAVGSVGSETDPAGANATRQLNYENVGSVGMSFEATPYIGLESMELDMNLRLSEENGLTAQKLPIINSRRLHTTVRLLDGQPYVLAGLTRKNSDQSSAKAPWLGDLPIAGYLFGGETNMKRDTQLVITITPHFYVSSQAKIAKPPRIDTLQLIIDGTQPLGLPQSTLGYDQWIFDKRG